MMPAWTRTASLTASAHRITLQLRAGPSAPDHGGTPSSQDILMRLSPLVPALCVLLSVSPAQAQTPPRPFLFKDVRVELAAARARGDNDVLLVIASMPKENAKVAAAIGAMGGTVQFRSDDVDYLRARVPLDRVDALAADAKVHSISISFRPQQQGGGGNDNTIIATDTTRRREWPPMLLSDYPIRNRYDPIGDLRANDFLKQHPTYDGRGVTLAIIDMSLDPLLPELQ